MIYQLPFAGEIEVNTPKEACHVVRHLCDYYCKKAGIGRFHCPYVDAKKCNEFKDKIVADFSKKK